MSNLIVVADPCWLRASAYRSRVFGRAHSAPRAASRGASVLLKLSEVLATMFLVHTSPEESEDAVEERASTRTLSKSGEFYLPSTDTSRITYTHIVRAKTIEVARIQGRGRTEEEEEDGI
eukprot:2475949-Pleurochrysis_carterae.AAC.2